MNSASSKYPLIFNTNNINIYYQKHLDGGGIKFGQSYITFLKEKISPVEHVFEFCSGPGFIGFALLAHGICKKLTLADINPLAVEACRETIRMNCLEDKVTVYQSNGMNELPSTLKFDLVVGNPPHFYGDYKKYYSDIRTYDPEWSIHKNFFQNIGKHLNPNAKIIIQENRFGLSPEQIIEMLNYTQLSLINCTYENGSKHKRINKKEKILSSLWLNTKFIRETFPFNLLQETFLSSVISKKDSIYFAEITAHNKSFFVS